MLPLLLEQRMQFDQPKWRDPPDPESLPALWLLAGVAVVLAALPASFARSPASDQDKELTVLAAASMQHALDDINAAFTESTGVKVIASTRRAPRLSSRLHRERRPTYSPRPTATGWIGV